MGAEWLYRPGKQAVMRALGLADADVIAWGKKDGQGYHFPPAGCPGDCRLRSPLCLLLCRGGPYDLIWKMPNRFFVGSI